MSAKRQPRASRFARWTLVALAWVAISACGGSSTEEPTPPPAALPAGQLHERAAERGMVFRFRSDPTTRKLMYETMGGGVVLFDADGDHDLDVFVPGGGSAAGSSRQAAHQGFFRNTGQGIFENATATAGLEPQDGDAFTLAGAAEDVDGDGDLDLYVTALGANRLYLNDGTGHFTRQPRAGGAEGDAWSAAAAFLDADGDGDADLYVINYVEYDPEDELPCTLGGQRIYCTPILFTAAANAFYRNDGGRFVEVTEAVGLGGSAGKSLAVAAADFDADGDLDLYVANDSTPNTLWVNDGSGRFVEEALMRGVALGRDGREEASMGIAFADLDRDGDLDTVVPNFSSEVYNLYRQDAGGFFTDVATASGLAATTAPLLGFGVVAADFDLDGWIDLAFANGHINDLADDLLVATTFRQPNLLLRNVGGAFEAWPERTGDFARTNVARGLAAGDLDGDGDVDLVVSRIDGPLALFSNGGAPTSRWVAVAPRRASGAPATGAWARLELADGDERVAHLASAGSYGSQNEPVLRFGLAEGEQPEALVIRWLSGAEQRLEAPAPGQVLEISEPVN
ncbi:MAG: CRTAC1 family protein [Acidobacteriota bacterium]